MHGGLGKPGAARIWSPTHRFSSAAAEASPPLVRVSHTHSHGVCQPVPHIRPQETKCSSASGCHRNGSLEMLSPRGSDTDGQKDGCEESLTSSLASSTNTHQRLQETEQLEARKDGRFSETSGAPFSREPRRHDRFLLIGGDVCITKHTWNWLTGFAKCPLLLLPFHRDSGAVKSQRLQPPSPRREG